MDVRQLDDDGAWALLASVNIGRLGSTTGALPIVLPVIYLPADPQRLLFAVDSSSPLLSSLDDGVFAFEASGPHPIRNSWWCVIARGWSAVLEPDDLAAAFDRLELADTVVPVVGSVQLLRGGEVTSSREIPALAAHLCRMDPRRSPNRPE